MKKVMILLGFCCIQQLIFGQISIVGYPLLFENGFEQPTWVEQYYENGYYGSYSLGDLHNPDATVTTLSNWDEDLEENHDLGNWGNWGEGSFRIKYAVGNSQGNRTQRFAEIISDPTSWGNNKVLSTWVSETYSDPTSYNCGGGARVETILNSQHQGNDDKNGTGFEVLHYSIKFYLPEQFEQLANDIDYELYPGGLTIVQLWNDFKNSVPNTPGYRINTMIKKNQGELGFKLHVTAHRLEEASNVVQWEENTLNTIIPIEQWNTLDIYFKEGDNTNGRYRLKLNGETLVDRTDWTHHPDVVGQDGLSSINPFEIYLANCLVEEISNLGYRTEVYWDDFKIYGDSKLKRKHLKVISPADGTTITQHNAVLEAEPIDAILPNGNLPDDWLYVFWLTNLDDPDNIIYPPGQKTRFLNLSPYIQNGQLKNNAHYRVYTAVRNHPFLDRFGPAPEYDMEFTTGFIAPDFEKSNTKEEGISSVQITPNPVQKYLTIEGYTGMVEILDANGHMVLQKNLQNTNQIDVARLQSGVYFIRLSIDGLNDVRKFIKN